MAQTFHLFLREDSSAEVYGRLTARTGSGAVVGAPGEGRWLQQADTDGIVYSVFDLTAEETLVDNSPLASSSVILNTPVEPDDDGVWTQDEYGYNFRHVLSHNLFTEPEHRYRVEYRISLAGLTYHFWGVYEGMTEPMRSS